MSSYEAPAPVFPQNLSSDPVEAFKAGWYAGIEADHKTSGAAGGRIGGKIMTPKKHAILSQNIAKARAVAKATGKTGGRPIDPNSKRQRALRGEL